MFDNVQVYDQRFCKSKTYKRSTIKKMVINMQYYKIIISEPWDYVDSKGNNIISGQILNIINEKSLVFQANENIYINGLTSMYFLLSPRYAPFQIRNIPKTLTINGGVLPQNYSKVSNHEYLFEKIKFVFIGELSCSDV